MRSNRTVRREPTSEAGTSRGDAAQLPTPPPDPLVDARTSLRATLSNPGPPKSLLLSSPGDDDGGGADRSTTRDSWFGVSARLLSSRDAVKRFSENALNCMTTAEMVRQLAKGYALLSQRLHGGGGSISG